jgi:hypothetical protein
MCFGKSSAVLSEAEALLLVFWLLYSKLVCKILNTNGITGGLI